MADALSALITDRPFELLSAPSVLLRSMAGRSLHPTHGVRDIARRDVTPQRVFERYCSAISSGDAEAVADLFADDGFLEHPIGTERVAGRAAIVERYRAVVADTAPQVSLTGPVRSTEAGPAAAPVLSRALIDGEAVDIDVIDVATFDGDGKITTLFGYWGPDTTRPRDERDLG